MLYKFCDNFGNVLTIYSIFHQGICCDFCIISTNVITIFSWEKLDDRCCEIVGKRARFFWIMKKCAKSCFLVNCVGYVWCHCQSIASDWPSFRHRRPYVLTCCLDIATFLSLGVACVVSSCFFLGHRVLAGHCILLGQDTPALHFSWGKTHSESGVSFCLLPPPLRQCLQYNGWPIRHQGTQ